MAKPANLRRVLYSVFWQLAHIFKIIAKTGWHHTDAHPHNITVTNGLTTSGGLEIPAKPKSIQVLTDTQAGGSKEIKLPTAGIQIALIDYNLVRHPDFQKAEWQFFPYGAPIDGEIGRINQVLELKRRLVAIAMDEHGIMAEVNRRKIPLRHYGKMRNANHKVLAKMLPGDYSRYIAILSNDTLRRQLGYGEYFAEIRRKVNLVDDDPDNKFSFRMMYIRIETELFWLWQLEHPTELSEAYELERPYPALIPKSEVMDILFGQQTTTLDGIMTYCLNKLTNRNKK